MKLLLASSSPIRRAMLEAAGIEFEARAPGIDEDRVKARLSQAGDIATELARSKALAVSEGELGAWVIGSDSVVSVHGRLFDKPRDRGDAADHLRFFSGNSMRLTSAVVLARGGSVDWTHAATATLRVRPLSEEFIEDYLEQEWPEVSYCVGVFRLEGRGVQLFERIEGDHFTILGMPLLPLLAALRERGVLRS